ncbi:MAG: transcription elongation factor GreAB [Verrucomicrobiota bacterium JB025]|nr:transcription elongation factor GreAB [Verrucomicrobiota bacterium JB025]
MKQALIEIIRAELGSRLKVVSKAAMEAHAAATDPDSKAEGKYDTRSLEASYLASGQARQVEEMTAAARVFDVLELAEFGMEDAVDAGALVEVDLGGESEWFLLAPASGGLVVEFEGREVTLLTPESPLYRRLVGLRVGEMVENLLVMEVC